jgi:hypothetical protein
MYPKGHWKDIQNHVAYARVLAEKYGWTGPEGWKGLSQKHFKESDGRGLLFGTYRGSPWEFIINVVAPFIHPNELWLEWKIGCQAPNGFWKDSEKVRFCLDVLASEAGVISLDGFYTIRQDTYKKHGVTSIQNKFSSHLDMLRFAYPEKEWKEWKFRPVTRNYWNVRENIICAMKGIEQEEGITDPSDWYRHTVATIDKHCGAGLIPTKYDSSLIKLLRDIYPDYPWKPYMLVKAPHQYWLEDANCRKWLSEYMLHCAHNAPEDLYKTRHESLVKYPGATGIIDRFGGYINTFVYLYPELDRVAFYKAGVSKIANEYLSSIEDKLGTLEREFRIPGKRWHADGYHRATNTVFEFLGDYWHGNPSKYPSQDINPSTGITYGEMYRNTIERLDAIRECGFNVVFVWECDWKASC